MEFPELTEEVARLQGITQTIQAQLNKPKSRLDNFKDYAGVLSLMISLVIGTFTVWHNLVIDPANVVAEREVKLETILAEVTVLDEDATAKISRPAGEQANTISFIETRRNILLKEAENYAQQGSTSNDEFYLANLFEYGGSYKKALDHYIKAKQMATKNSDDDVLTSLKLAQYDYNGLNGSLSEGRKILTDLEKAADNNPFSSVESSEKFTYILQNRAILECVKGDSENSNKAVDRLNGAFVSMLAQQPLTADWVTKNRRITGISLSNSQCRSNPAFAIDTAGANSSGQANTSPTVPPGAQEASPSQTTAPAIGGAGSLSQQSDPPALDLDSLKVLIAYAGVNRLGDLRTVGPDTKIDATEFPSKVNLPLATHCVVFSSTPPEKPMNIIECFTKPSDLAEAELIKARFIADARLVPGITFGNSSPDPREIRFTAANGVHLTIRGTNDFSVKKTVSMFIFPPEATGY